MQAVSLLPADIYTVINKTVLTEKDKDNIVSLYTPIIGSLAVTLYFTLCRDLNKLEMMSVDLTHHHLMAILRTDLESIKKARESLEAIGLVKSFVRRGDVNQYVYELYSPLTPLEFLNHPVLNVVLYKNIGKREYDLIKLQYTKMKFNMSDYEDVTVSLNDAFKSSTSLEPVFASERTSLGITVNDVVDFDFLSSMMPKGVTNEKTFNTRMKELINNLAFIYNLDTYKMGEVLRQLINDNGVISTVELRNNVRKLYQYNNGTLPTMVYQNQPEYLKTPICDNSNKSKIISVFENTNPYEFLRAKNKGSKPTLRDLKIIEELITVTGLKPAVVNVIIDYSLKKNDNKINKAYIEAIAGSMKRNGIETAKDALDSIMSDQKKSTKKSTYNKRVSKEEPKWLNETVEKEEISQSDVDELTSLLKGFN